MHDLDCDIWRTSVRARVVGALALGSAFLAFYPALSR